jgi:hypothetical protein
MEDNKTKEKSKRKAELADIIQEGIGEYIDTYGNLPEKHWKVINNIIQCRTEKLGGHVYECDACGHQQSTFNSCRDRHCPKCEGIARAAWVERRTSELLPVGYFHVVFTLPDQFNGIGIKNKKVFYDILYRSVSETLLELGKDPRWLGGRIGFMAVLHSWGQQLLEHSHIHCIVPGGGIRLDGKKWVSFRTNYLFPTDVLSQVFRGKFLDYFGKAVENSRLYFVQTRHNCRTREGLRDFIREQHAKDWVVYAKKPFGSAEQVVKYLGRYTHRIAISNKRILSENNGKVTFRWKDYRDGNKQKTMELSRVEFLRRFFLHVLPDGFVRIRYYGLLSNGRKTEKLKKCFELLEKKYEKKEIVALDIVSIMQSLFGIDLTLCPKCRAGHFRAVKEILKKPQNAYQKAA